MGKTNFFVLWSVREAPRQFISKSNRRCYQVQIPLPLPSHLVLFSVGDWGSFSRETTVSAEVLVSSDGKPQNIGTLTPRSRCLVWEGDWNSDLLHEAADKRRRGACGKVLLTVCGEVRASLVSSTPAVRRKRPVQGRQPHQLSNTVLTSCGNQTINSILGETVSYAEIKTDFTGPCEATITTVPGICCTDKTPMRTSSWRRETQVWSSEELGSPQDSSHISSPKKRKLSETSTVGSEIDRQRSMVKRRKSGITDRPSERWSHNMCLTDPQTAIVIGGEGAEQTQSVDSLWKLEIDNDFWFPMNSSTSGPVLPSSRGHSATFDPESKLIYVYGGMRDGQCYSDVHVLDTKTWEWNVFTAKGNIPTLAYHSAVIYRKELYVFGGVLPSRNAGKTTCSNALYIFNPEFGLWYQPIVEGDRPLPRFGHSTILVSNQLVIFGGRKTAAFLNDMHILDLGFMEYSSVKYDNMPPLPRGFHAALPISDNKILISGGCSALGALQDAWLFNLNTSSWSSVSSPLLCSKPRAGHSLISLVHPVHPGTRQSNHEHQHHHTQPATKHTILVFGGSDGAENFYNDTATCTVEIPAAENTVVQR